MKMEKRPAKEMPGINIEKMKQPTGRTIKPAINGDSLNTH